MTIEDSIPSILVFCVLEMSPWQLCFVWRSSGTLSTDVLQPQCVGHESDGWPFQRQVRRLIKQRKALDRSTFPVFYSLTKWKGSGRSSDMTRERLRVDSLEIDPLRRSGLLTSRRPSVRNRETWNFQYRIHSLWGRTGLGIDLPEGSGPILKVC